MFHFTKGKELEKFFTCLPDNYFTQKPKAAIRETYTLDLTFTNMEKPVSEVYRSYKKINKRGSVTLEWDTGRRVRIC